MFLTNTKRVLKWGLVNFMRNGIVSFSSILVMVVALFMIGSTILLSVYLNAALIEVENKIDINVYFSVDAEGISIQNLQRSLELLPEVQSVTYVSKEEALEEFKERHANDELTIQALKELNENPLRARLNIQAVSSEQYDVIAGYLQNDAALTAEYGPGFIDKVNYADNKMVIERMNRMISGIEQAGFTVALALLIISILITLNTIRLAIYISRDEISVMKLVGADNMYVRGPFIVAGTLYGIIAALITIGAFYPITSQIKKHTEEFFGGIDLFKYYIANFQEIFLILFVTGAALGAISSYLAVRRYLKK